MLSIEMRVECLRLAVTSHKKCDQKAVTEIAEDFAKFLLGAGREREQPGDTPHKDHESASLIVSDDPRHYQPCHTA
jgi:hypothetical protein